MTDQAEREPLPNYRAMASDELERLAYKEAEPDSLLSELLRRYMIARKAFLSLRLTGGNTHLESLR